MPHVAITRRLLNSCYRKRPFDSPAEAITELHNVYHCNFCGKWHRASTREFREIREQRQAQQKARRKREAWRRRNAGPLMDELSQSLRDAVSHCDCVVLFCERPCKGSPVASYLAALRAEHVPHMCICSHTEAKPAIAVSVFLQEHDALSLTWYVLPDTNRTLVDYARNAVHEAVALLKSMGTW
jgi:hypothetical protein